MIAAFGYFTTALAFLLTVYGLIATVWGLSQQSPAWIESARLALLLIFPLVTAGLFVMVILLLNNRFDVAYVTSVISRDMPVYLKITALWGGQSGSLLFWGWLLAGFSVFFSIRKWQDDFDLLPWALMVVFISLGFFLALIVFLEVPFERIWHFPDGTRVLSVFQPAGAWSVATQDGQGLNPLLRHPGMIWHPPALYLGFVGFIIPFSLAIASLASGRKDRRWLEIARPWTLITWVFLTLGLVLGMRWAYDVLGWGGYWGWDPVEIAALMPWLSATAFMHTAFLQRRRDSFKRWNAALITLTFGLVIFGSFITRSGVLSSVHSFAASDIGLPMFFYLAVISLGSLGLLIHRWPQLRAAYEPEFKFSREVLTLFSNFVLLSILMVCFLGVIYPIISELVTDVQVTVGPTWYKRINGPLFTLLLFLLGVCPLAGWSSTNIVKLRKRLVVLVPISLLIPLVTWFFGGVRSVYALVALWLAGLGSMVILEEYTHSVCVYRRQHPGKIISVLIAPLQSNRRQYGGLLVHLGIVLMSVGIIGIEGFQKETQATLALGESVTLSQYVFTFESLDNYTSQDGRNITEAELTVSRNGNVIGALYPQRDFYPSMGMAITQPGLKSNLLIDLYAILIDWRPVSQDQATFRIYINPLVNWLWIGTGVLTAGAAVAVWPETEGKRVRSQKHIRKGGDCY